MREAKSWWAALICLSIARVAAGQCVIEPSGTLAGGTFLDATRLSPTRAVFASAQSIGLLDTSDFESPSVIQDYPTSSATGVAVWEDHVYISQPGISLLVYEASDPNHLALVRSISVSAYDLEAADGMLYGTGDLTGPLILDLSEPSNPMTLSEGASLTSFAPEKDGDLLWCPITIGSQRRLLVWQISDPRNPVLVSDYQYATNYASSYCLIDRVFYVIVEDQITLIDYTAPTSPEALNPIPIPSTQQWDRIFVRQNTLYAVLGSTVYLYDVTNARQPVLLRSMTVDGEPPIALKSVNFDQDRAMGLSGSTRLLFMSVENNGDLTVTGEIRRLSLQPSGKPTELLAIPGGFAAITGTERMLQIYSTSDPDRPELTWSRIFPTPYDSHMAVNGDYLYVSMGVNGVFIFDISDLHSPTQVAQIDATPPYITGNLDATGHYLAVIRQFGTVDIFDVTDPSTPTLTGAFQSSDIVPESQLILVDGAIYYRYNRRLRSIDISDPYNPTRGFYEPFPAFAPLIMRGNRMYASALQGRNILSVTDPWAPDPISTITEASHSPIEVDGHLLMTQFWGSSSSIPTGLAAVDILDPAQPRVVARYPYDEHTQDIIYTSGRFYALTQSGTLKIYRVSDCEPCIADYFEDGQFNFFDIANFLADFAGQTWSTDLDQNGAWNFLDLSLMLNSYQTGCP